MIDRQRIEEMVRQALRSAHGEARAAAPVESGGALLLRPDRGHNLASPYDPAAMRRLLEATPARIGVGRVSGRYRTNTMLRFRADHAFAKDAVMTEVDPGLVKGLGLLEVATAAASKHEYLTRPDLGRTLSDEGRKLVGSAGPRSAQLLVMYGDGLSAAAVLEHLPTFHAALLRELAATGVRPGSPCLFLRHSRVKVMDEVARLLAAEAALFVCGERPGLGFADSLSAYYIYSPAEGATDADREVISNINPRGLPPAVAATAVAKACARVLRERRSGVSAVE